MKRFELSIHIQRARETCFAFLRDKDLYPQEPDSPVLRLDKTTPGPVQVGTRYIEVVQMFPLIKGEIRSVITRYQPPEWLEETFEGGGMMGHLSYQFVPEAGGTRLIQRERWQLQGLLCIFEPLLARMLLKRLQWRLAGIKEILEQGWQEQQVT